jgi:hypothetical protein
VQRREESPLPIRSRSPSKTSSLRCSYGRVSRTARARTHRALALTHRALALTSQLRVLAWINASRAPLWRPHNRCLRGEETEAVRADHARSYGSATTAV